MNEMKISIKSFRTDDCAELSALIIRTTTISNSKDYSQDQIDEFISHFSLEKIRSYASDRATYVAVADDKIVGTAGLAKHYSRKSCAIMLSVFVDPDYQGRGIGKSLVQHVEMHAKEHPSHTMVVPSSLTAHGFYKKLGYADEEPTVDPQAINIWMSKRLKGKPPPHDGEHSKQNEKEREERHNQPVAADRLLRSPPLNRSVMLLNNSVWTINEKW